MIVRQGGEIIGNADLVFLRGWFPGVRRDELGEGLAGRRDCDLSPTDEASQRRGRDFCFYAISTEGAIRMGARQESGTTLDNGVSLRFREI